MSYVKAGIISKGRLTVVEVHGNELFLSRRERIKSKRLGTKLSMAENSGTARDRKALGIDELDTEEKIERWIACLRESHCPGYADSGEGYPLNCLVDFDIKLFSSMRRDCYADNQEGLANDWTYQETSVESIEECLFCYAKEVEHEGSDIHRGTP